MKRLLLAGAAVLALTTASRAADVPAAYEPVAEAWDGFFVGIQGGWNFADLSGDVGGTDFDEDVDDFVIGLYYGRNWQFDNWVLGLDSSISYIGIEESDVDGIADFDVEANILGLSRAKVGIAADNFLFFVAGGLATTMWDVDTATDGDDGFGFGWTVGAGVETKFAENWSARIEYIYYDIQDDASTDDVADIDFEIEGSIIRGGIAYHF